MTQNIFLAIGMMIIFGALGGLVNYFWSGEEKPEQSVKLIKSLLSGILGAIIIPLVLQMIANNSLSWMESEEFSASDAKAFMVFIAFCAIGGIGGEALLRTVSSKLIKMIEEANNRTLANQTNLQKIVSANSEPEKDESSVTTFVAALNTLPETDNKERQIIEAFKNSTFRLRSVSGIAKQTNLDAPSVVNTLKELEKKEFVDSLMGNDGNLKWYLKV